MPESAPTPIRDSVSSALRFTREHWRFILVLAAGGAVATVLLQLLALIAPAVTLLAVIGVFGVQALVYAMLTSAALSGPEHARRNFRSDGLRMWGAMAVIGFFMFIVLGVVSIPVAIALGAGPLGPYVADLQAAGSDPVAVQALMMRFAQEEPLTMLVVLLFYVGIVLYLTSRLYFAAPATIDKGRVLTFDTWNWTKGLVLTIIGARALLLLPASLLVSALTQVLQRIVGTADNAILLATVLVSTFVTFALPSALEAALSAALYRQLRPAEAPRAAP